MFMNLWGCNLSLFRLDEVASRANKSLLFILNIHTTFLLKSQAFFTNKKHKIITPQFTLSYLHFNKNNNSYQPYKIDKQMFMIKMRKRYHIIIGL